MRPSRRSHTGQRFRAGRLANGEITSRGAQISVNGASRLRNSGMPEARKGKANLTGRPQREKAGTCRGKMKEIATLVDRTGKGPEENMMRNAKEVAMKCKSYTRASNGLIEKERSNFECRVCGVYIYIPFSSPPTSSSKTGTRAARLRAVGLNLRCCCSRASGGSVERQGEGACWANASPLLVTLKLQGDNQSMAAASSPVTND